MGYLTKDINNFESASEVAKVFEDTNVLVTGASGFLGKVLIEKLLHDCRGIKHIYLLIRIKRGQDATTRLESLIKSPLFDRVRKSDASLLNKLVAIDGDLLSPELGITQQNSELLQKEVGIIFHCAATVKFDDILRTSLEMNLLGTTKLIALAKKMANLKCIVHASTAYANCHLSETMEKVYPPPINPTKLVDALGCFDDEMIETITPKILKTRPNTYTFTKALAESQFIEDCKDLPAIIIRPSIIGACWSEPCPGWTDNYNGPTGMITAVGKCVLRYVPGKEEMKADIIPVDIVSNLMVVCAYHRITNDTKEIPVVHCTSGVLNPVRWKNVQTFTSQFFRDYPFADTDGLPFAECTDYQTVFNIDYYVRGYFPAKALDFVNGVIGKKSNYGRTYDQIYKMIATLKFFTNHEWHFHSENLVKIWDTLGSEDKERFNFDVRQVEWNKYFYDYLMGIKIYLFKQTFTDIKKEQKRAKKLWRSPSILHMIFWFIAVRLFAW
uniref:Fatty acyl-CoA reductase n=1 Tax=Rhabditophanes sp. KR3021 TaxID=114890 RepID=A0AC35U6J4_9BILA